MREVSLWRRGRKLGKDIWNKQQSSCLGKDSTGGESYKGMGFLTAMPSVTELDIHIK